MPDRYRREIEDILSQQPEFVLDNRSVKDMESVRSEESYYSIVSSIYRKMVMPISICAGLLLAAIFASAIFAGPVGPLLWICLILFVMVYALLFSRPKSTIEKRWRGRSIEYQPSESLLKVLLARLGYWLKR